jgi:hypothetical protein
MEQGQIKLLIMKKNFCVIAMFVLACSTFSSCGHKQNQTSSDSDSIAMDTPDTVAEDTCASSDQTSSEGVSSSDESSVEDVDAALDEYEEYMDKCIKLSKKMASGDMSVASEYTDLINSAKEVGDKLDGVKGQLTSEQLERFTKIQEKLMQAAQETN